MPKLADKKLELFIKDIKKEFDVFFDFKIKDPSLYFVASRKDFDLIVGRKTENWLVAIVRANSIYILDRKIFAKESNHKKEEFWLALKHEYSHIYYSQIIKSHYPIWLNEGLASHLSGKKIIVKEKDQKQLLNVFGYYKKSGKDVYTVSQYWVEFLLKEYGHEKLIQLIKSLDIKAELSSSYFNQQFYKIYGFSFNKKTFAKFL
jgi:hypothetical protein